MGKILLLHPEGNISNNPNLSGIVELLCDYGHEIEIISPIKSHYQCSPDPRATLTLERSPLLSKLKNEIFKRVSSLLVLRCMYFFLRQKQKNYDLLIGVDREGIIEACLLADAWRVPYGFISYEIFFEREIGKRLKKVERKACGNVTFAISQDPLRANLLCKENCLSVGKVINVPVAGRKVVKGKRLYSLHNKLGIDKNKKIALFAGSIDKWTMIDELVDHLHLWPDDWVVVLHDRYGKFVSTYEGKLDQRFNLFIYDTIISSQNEMYQLLHAVDLGIAFYKPTYDCIYTGLNLKYLGFSSGKVSTYLQHGVPVLINDVGEISELIKAEGVGIVIDDFHQIPMLLQGFSLEEYREKCFDFFDKHLSLEKKSANLLTVIENACARSS